MLLNLDHLRSIESETIWLELTPAEIALAQPNPQLYANQTGLTNAELNQLCLTKFQAWLVEQEISFTMSFTPDELTKIWDVVTGCAIEIGKTRLILIPTYNLDRDELTIPQEWIDLPNWVGDYYLGIQIDLEAGAMNIWGFASHQLIKNRGEYHHSNHSYSLDSDLLVTNLDLLWMAQALELNERVTVVELPTLDLEPALALIQHLSIPSVYSPRSKVPFFEWGAILNSPNLRSELYQTRLQRAILDRTPVASFRLLDWVQNEFTNALASGWQTYQPAIGMTRSQNTIERAK